MSADGIGWSQGQERSWVQAWACSTGPFRLPRSLPHPSARPARSPKIGSFDWFPWLPGSISGTRLLQIIPLIDPLAALESSLAGRWARLRIWIQPASAGKLLCHQCTLHCPVGIPVMESFVLPQRPSVTDPRCIRCGECAQRCPGNVLRLGFTAKGN